MKRRPKILLVPGVYVLLAIMVYGFALGGTVLLRYMIGPMNTDNVEQTDILRHLGIPGLAVLTVIGIAYGTFRGGRFHPVY